ncbi:hypothetical protein [Vibrio genomosp. F6]|uniref:Uncharacterized protein n=1 Tax=Vibrio genomosp. F6 str. FF-238 TaxID=1191298 RepID=A0A1E5CZR6_9VIBR|nr:hypothetical protein [Vibrio genomosp. F6]OEE76439.1 hypothetical protein A130_15480 [Vibrio genomosp. F6 str. FF-238]
MRTRFKLLVHESNAQAYEDLFVKIMKQVDLNFKPVKPHGNIGDRGNDGWCSDRGVYYQVYAPESLPSNSSQSLAKLHDDFQKLKNYWDSISPLKEFYFVVNDKFSGAPPHLYDAVAKIKKDYNLSRAEVILSHQLENMLFDLSDDVVASIVGSASVDSNMEFYQHVVDSITSNMYLKSWTNISDNLFANSIESAVIDGFERITMKMFKTVMPNVNQELEEAITELMNRVQYLVDHFTDSPYVSNFGDFWKRDMSWKKTRIEDQNEYLRIYEQYEGWCRELFVIHRNLVHALNLFSAQVRSYVYPNYFMGQQFTIVDSIGTSNSLQGYEAIPTTFDTNLGSIDKSRVDSIYTGVINLISYIEYQKKNAPKQSIPATRVSLRIQECDSQLVIALNEKGRVNFMSGAAFVDLREFSHLRMTEKSYLAERISTILSKTFKVSCSAYYE